MCFYFSQQIPCLRAFNIFVMICLTPAEVPLHFSEEAAIAVITSVVPHASPRIVKDWLVDLVFVGLLHKDAPAASSESVFGPRYVVPMDTRVHLPSIDNAITPSAIACARFYGSLLMDVAAMYGEGSTAGRLTEELALGLFIFN